MAGRGLVVVVGALLAVGLYWGYFSGPPTVTVVTTEVVLNGVPVHPLLKKEGASLDDPRVIKV